jgi:ribosomal protein L29
MLMKILKWQKDNEGLVEKLKNAKHQLANLMEKSVMEEC